MIDTANIRRQVLLLRLVDHLYPVLAALLVWGLASTEGPAHIALIISALPVAVSYSAVTLLGRRSILAGIDAAVVVTGEDLELNGERALTSLDLRKESLAQRIQATDDPQELAELRFAQRETATRIICVLEYLTAIDHLHEAVDAVEKGRRWNVSEVYASYELFANMAGVLATRLRHIADGDPFAETTEIQDDVAALKKRLQTDREFMYVTKGLE